MGFQITHMCRSPKNVVQIDQQNFGISTTNKKTDLAKLPWFYHKIGRPSTILAASR